MSDSPRRSIAHFASLTLLLLVGACASVAVTHPPRIDVVGVALDRVEGADAYFRIDLQLASQVPDEMVIEALQGSLAIEGENIAQATLVGAPVRIPGNGTAMAELTARTRMDAVLRVVADAMRRGATIVAPGARPVLHYTIDGSATVAGGGRIPFRRSGDLGERKPG